MMPKRRNVEKYDNGVKMKKAFRVSLTYEGNGTRAL